MALTFITCEINMTAICHYSDCFVENTHFSSVMKILTYSSWDCYSAVSWSCLPIQDLRHGLTGQRIQNVNLGYFFFFWKRQWSVCYIIWNPLSTEILSHLFWKGFMISQAENNTFCYSCFAINGKRYKWHYMSFVLFFMHCLGVWLNPHQVLQSWLQCFMMGVIFCTQRFLFRR